MPNPANATEERRTGRTPSTLKGPIGGQAAIDQVLGDVLDDGSKGFSISAGPEETTESPDGDGPPVTTADPRICIFTRVPDAGTHSVSTNSKSSIVY